MFDFVKTIKADLVWNNVKLLAKKKAVRQGLPFFFFLFLGAFGLREFRSLRYEFPRTTELAIQRIKEEGIEFNPKSIEEVYETIKDKNLDYENKRVPRPWDEEEEAAA